MNELATDGLMARLLRHAAGLPINEPQEEALKPLRYLVTDGVWLDHGERAEGDPDHPHACLCGHPDYLLCAVSRQGLGK